MKLKDIIKDSLNRLFEIETEDHFTVESVYYRGDTLCVSSQLGCPVRCSFCASGMNGLIRNLSYDEIIDQYRIAVSEGMEIKNIAFAGIGEPLLNWENVKKAFYHFKDIGLKASFYTTGFPLKNFKELLELPHNGVSLSLHAVTDEKRKQLIPYGQPLDQILDVFKDHLSKLSRRKRKMYSIAYLLIGGVNDSEEEIQKLSQIARDLQVGVSLLKYNEIDGIDYRSTSDEEYERVFLQLRENGIRVTLSNRYRTRKIGGCGTLMINRTVLTK
ncbi:MAG TPA: radical SAM protein [Persephonella sp.]|uniref:Radical SAM enzyme, Cfr family n=1 Tax=Persephonella marina (strain DSM 14350 / EX-H1) TaxID=123214 RepID=C0QTQ8_PERMH|nr:MULTISPECIES: radical SAM protein [Persephonella]ACO04436.1 radical SAM enzyme, Cfr family [Persephonella marina EX-H1]HCB70310.1 radical SAM protein [Persephonella sp.]